MLSTEEESTDTLIMNQKNRIEAEIAATTPLVSGLEPVSALADEFAGDEAFHAKAVSLAQNYGHVRRTRPDGNCFFRAVAFRYLEALQSDAAEFATFRARMAPTLDALCAAGFPKLTTGDFAEVFLQVVDGVGPDGTCRTASDLEAAFNDQELSDYTVMYLRLLTSLELQSNADFYQNFLDEGRALRDFCATDVEPMFVESDHIHITALTAATGIRVRVAYLDRGANANATTHNFPDDGAADPKVHLLYRPGHYDILYPKAP